MIYPLDPTTIQEYLERLNLHNQTQTNLIKELNILLIEAMNSSSNEESWHKDAKRLIASQKAIENEQINRRFNEANLEKQQATSFKPTLSLSRTAQRGNTQFDDGTEMTEAELMTYFGETEIKTKKEPDKLSTMTLEEIKEWEKAQDNSLDIYKIKARVMNLAREGCSITPTGEMLCNTFVHVLKSLYSFAEQIEDKNIRIQLIEKIRSHETMPAQFIKSTKSEVKEG